MNVALTVFWALIIAGIACAAVVWLVKEWPDGDDFPDNTA